MDQKILDETFTPFGWKRSHQMLDGNLYCTVEIWDGEKQQWIGKQDVGTTSYTEKEKGQASDSFKRACFNWGVGRELYTAPFIWLGADQIANGRGQVVYRMGKRADSGPHGGTEVSSQQIRELKKELERTGVPLRNVLDRYRITDLDQMTEETYRNAMSGLKKSRNRDVA